ncbi:hypothetical protein D9601_04075 [Sphingomonas sp. MA1305]|nr:hypothetical protein [Sphingomonas sp. MA1305]
MLFPLLLAGGEGDDPDARAIVSSFPRRRESRDAAMAMEPLAPRVWIPAFAGMTVQVGWEDGRVQRDNGGAPPVIAGFHRHGGGASRG